VTRSAFTWRTFLKRLPVSLVIAGVLWALLRPALGSAVTGLAEVLIRAYEYPRVTRLNVGEGRVRVERSDFRVGSKIPTLPLTEVHFNTVVLLALFLALERPFSRRRLERLVMGWSVLLLTQTLNLVFHVKTLYAIGLGEWSEAHYSGLAQNLFAYGQYFTDLPGRFAFPFLIWLAFSWDDVTGMLSEPPGGSANTHADTKAPRGGRASA
jgi:hypothetical protein